MSNDGNGSATGGDLSKATNPEILARVDRCGLSDREVEKRSGIPQAFISKARRGGSATGKASPSWRRLLSWLDTYHPEPVKAQAPRANGSPEGPGLGTPVVEELVARYRAAASPREYLNADQYLLELAARGDVDRQVAQTILEISKEARQKLKYARQEEARIDARKAVEVRVVWVSDWREKVEHNRRADEEDGIG